MMKKYIVFLLTITLTARSTYQKCCSECVSKLTTDARKQAIDSDILPSVTTYEVPIKTTDEVNIEGFCGKVFEKYGTCCNQVELEKRAKAWTNRLKIRAKKIVQGFSKMSKLIDNIGKIEKWMVKHKDKITDKSEIDGEETDKNIISGCFKGETKTKDHEKPIKDKLKSGKVPKCNNTNGKKPDVEKKPKSGKVPKCNNSDGTMSVCGGPTNGKKPDVEKKPKSGKVPKCNNSDGTMSVCGGPTNGKKPDVEKPTKSVTPKPAKPLIPDNEKKPECNKKANPDCKPEDCKKPNGGKKPECMPKEGKTNCGNTKEEPKPTKPKEEEIYVTKKYEENDDKETPETDHIKLKQPKWKKHLKKPNAEGILKLGKDFAKFKKGDKTKREKREKNAQSQLSSCYKELMKIRKAALCMRCSGAASDFYDSETGSYKIKPSICFVIIDKCATVFAAIAEANNLYTNLATLKKAKGGITSDDAESETINDVELANWKNCGDDKSACNKDKAQVENLCKQISLSTDNQALEGNIATTSEGIASGDAISKDVDPTETTVTKFYSSSNRLLIPFLKTNLQRNLQESTDDGYGYAMPSKKGADLSSEFSSGFEITRVLSTIGFFIAFTIII